ncbi:MAG: hypothetical protein KGL21_07005, partial [Alphaproteobacteria bacterium]|nr:hypothetical protein [Alphaproteobacteria bacterium]
AAFTSASLASAQDAQPSASGGHYEWQTRGPAKPTWSYRARVWVSDAKPGAPEVANCDCAMMRDTAMAVDCMKMPHNSENHTKG